MDIVKTKDGNYYFVNKENHLQNNNSSIIIDKDVRFVEKVYRGISYNSKWIAAILNEDKERLKRLDDITDWEYNELVLSVADLRKIVGEPFTLLLSKGETLKIQ